MSSLPPPPPSLNPQRPNWALVYAILCFLYAGLNLSQVPGTLTMAQMRQRTDRMLEQMRAQSEKYADRKDLDPKQTEGQRKIQSTLESMLTFPKEFEEMKYWFLFEYLMVGLLSAAAGIGLLKMKAWSLGILHAAFASGLAASAHEGLVGLKAGGGMGYLAAGLSFLSFFIGSVLWAVLFSRDKSAYRPATR